MVLRRRIGAERAQLARTVEELGARLDVRSRLRQRRWEMRERVQARVRGLGLVARRFGSFIAFGAMAALRDILRAIRRIVEDLRSGRARGPRALPPAGTSPNSVAPMPDERAARQQVAAGRHSREADV